MWSEDTLYWIAKPSVRVDANRRLHCENGPALDSDVEPLYFWRGILIPSEWITHKEELTPQTALAWRNVEQRRCACEILGWERILSKLNARSIDKDVDPQIGELVEVDLPDAGPTKLLRYTCGTGRRFAEVVPKEMRTALEANAALYDIPADLLRQKAWRV